MTLLVDTNTSQPISANQTPATGRAIDYVADAVNLIIGDGVLVKSRDNQAISNLGHAQSVLFNDGNIVSDISSAVVFSGVGGFIVNNDGRSIIGAVIGISIGDGTVTNHGTVISLTDTGVSMGNCTLNNDGDIYGRFAGAQASDGAHGGSIFNSGTVRSDNFGILVNTNSGLTTVIHNSGTVVGTTAAIQADSGGISLINLGTVKGAIICSPDEDISDIDTIRNTGKITGDVHLGIGDDSFNGAGGTSGTVFGEDGNDTLIGGNASDTLNGGSGVDTLGGGRGTDLLTGGTEQDFFDFNSVKDSLKGSKRDQILDFNSGEDDKIDLSTIDAKTGSGNQAFKFIGTHGFHDVKGELRYIDKGSTCIVQGDINGDGKADFEIFVNASSLAKGDFVL